VYGKNGKALKVRRWENKDKRHTLNKVSWAGEDGKVYGKKKPIECRKLESVDAIEENQEIKGV
jgi:hypothetical protein